MSAPAEARNVRVRGPYDAATSTVVIAVGINAASRRGATAKKTTPETARPIAAPLLCVISQPLSVAVATAPAHPRRSGWTDLAVAAPIPGQ